ncbi:sigma-54-dependent Fis family transcriptional regulator [Aquisalimonas sp. 2447]|uniref:sigma-54-dependent transcriptional regulator n=1 Tax=Aquisalimonas sp. 2447 TaxID=2740807 RepID=UPI0014325F18|nr:sigma-54 dependent transcriptional regulator [Aquisalimonas sp. 2447]QIT55079.1 sigma-54-dependent Fis family transcriptional regulator [Aquisalimonas sp. 2447]
MTAPRILVIDDEKNFARSLVFGLQEEGMEAEATFGGAAGLDAVTDQSPDLILLDLRLPDMDGMEVLEQLTRDYPELPVVMISAHGDTRAAVQAVKAGASDYLTKPFALDEVVHLIETSTRRARMRSELDYHRQRLTPPSGLVGDSAPMKALWETVERVAGSSAARILLQGESGTGKALVARGIHAQSPRAHEAFVEINCAALPEQLIEAELFGAEKGAYTGAHQKRVGLVSLADRGTLFLDEVGELPLALQAKLLHFLENGDYRPVGASRSLSADVRVIAATNRALDAEVREGRFREDLYFRLNVIEIDIPPLRERAGDVEALLRELTLRQAETEGCDPVGFSETALDLLTRYRWPGHVRELKNVVERLTILYPGSVIEPGQLPVEIRDSEPRSDALGQQLDRTERQIVLDALNAAGGRKGDAATRLGISRHALKRRMQRLGLT